MPHKKFKECIDACNSCATACLNCASACLNEKHPAHLVKCIQLNLECAAICRAASELMSYGSEYSYQLCDLCLTVCSDCADECELHTKKGMDHCLQCAAECRKCAEQCRAMIAA